MKKAVGQGVRETGNDSVLAALEIIPDRWSALIVREAFFGVRRFSQFRRSLGIARNTLTDRLGRLVDQGVMVKHPVAESNEWEEYRLSEQGIDLYPVIVALMEWGDRWSANGVPSISLQHKGCGGKLSLKLECDKCGAPATARDVVYSTNSADDQTSAT